VIEGTCDDFLVRNYERGIFHHRMDAYESYVLFARRIGNPSVMDRETWERERYRTDTSDPSKQYRELEKAKKALLRDSGTNG
jgi:hypothetical protein